MSAIEDWILKMEKRVFAVRILSTVVGYVVITMLLNHIRANAPLWLVWTLIVPQLLLYFWIFVACEIRAVECGLNKYLGAILFLSLIILGRVNDWEVVIIPLLIAVTLIISAKTKKVGNKFASDVDVDIAK